MPLTLDNPLLAKRVTLLTLPPQGWEEHRLLHEVESNNPNQLSLIQIVNA